VIRTDGRGKAGHVHDKHGEVGKARHVCDMRRCWGGGKAIYVYEKHGGERRRHIRSTNNFRISISMRLVVEYFNTARGA